MKKSTVKISSIVEYQLPEFIRVEFPLLGQFLKEYYNYTETSFGPIDILRNISDYIKIDVLNEVRDTFYLYNNQIKISKIIKDSSLNNIMVFLADEFNYVNQDTIIIDNTLDPELDGKSFKITIPTDTEKLSMGLDPADNVFLLNDTKKGYSFKRMVPFKIKSSVTEEVVEYESAVPEIFIGDKDEVFAPIGEKIEIYDVFGQQLLLTIFGQGLNTPVPADLGLRFNGDRNIGIIKSIPSTIGTTTNNSLTDTSNDIIIYSENSDIRSLSLKYGLIKIDDEIILYKDISPSNVDIKIKNKNYKGIKLLNCVRGFSGITSLIEKDDELTFEKTFASSHIIDSEVLNLNSIFLKEFLRKIKYQILPGFEERDLDSKLNQSLFIKQAKDFYSSKGTETSFKILFSALYDKKVSVIRPSDFLISASNASYGVLRNLVVEALEGNPEELVNKTLYQDKTSFLNPARGTVSFVERIERDYKSYYVISIDDGYERDINYRGTLFSQFNIHPKTLVTEDVEVGSTTINVDSTVSFPDSGILEIVTLVPEEVNGEIILTGPFKLSISYDSKSTTQFFGCKTVGSIANVIETTILQSATVYSDAYAYGFSTEDPSKKIKVRISGVLSNFIQNEKTYLYEKENKIRIQSLGKETFSNRDNDWVYNIPVSYVIKNVVLKNIVNKIYEIEFYDTHKFFRSNIFSVQEDPLLECYITNIINDKKINVQFVRSGVQGFEIDLNQAKNWTLNKKISKVRLQNNPEASNYSANVQNTYLDKENNLYVAASSLPTYTDSAGTPFELDIKDGSISGVFLFGKSTSNGSSSQLQNKTFTDGTIDYSYITVFKEGSNGLESAIKHGFYTGDQIVFRSLEPDKSPIPDGIYYIKDFRVDGDLYGFKVARSTALIINERYETLDLIPPFNVPEFDQCKCIVQFFEYSDVNINSPNFLLPSKIEPRKIIKKISTPTKGQQKVTTNYGKIGIFKNGVEILNYKSRNAIFYGDITNINVTSPGYGYDIVNPPNLKITDFGGTQVKYNAVKSTAIFNFSDGRPIKYGAVGGDIITYDGDIDPQTGDPFGDKIFVNGKTLNLGEKNLYINQVNGTTLRINGLVATVGGEGGTQLSVGGQGGTDVRVGENNVTVGDVGTGSVIFPSITGSLERIDLLYRGFNYIGEPQIYIKGGNGSGAIAKPVMESFEYQIEFPASLNNGLLNLQDNIIGFGTYHNFENYEEVVYVSGSQNPILGLQNGSRYVVSVEDSNQVKLYKSKSDAFVGINTVNIDSFSSGKHYLKSSKNKSRIGFISIVNPGSGYRNRKTSTKPENVNIISNIIEIKNHGYSDGELIVHFSSGSIIGGLEENTPYYVTVIDSNNIKLSKIYEGSDNTKDFYYKTNQYINITGSGSGTHYFNYEPISIEIKGFIGVSTSAGQDLNAKVQPIFRGEIESIFISERGSNYGSSDILNYSKQPLVEVVKGINAQAIPLISDGVIQEVLVLNNGKNYNSVPDIVVRGDGSGAVLVPEIKNGTIEKINVLYGGTNYTRKNTIIEIIDRGEGLKTSVNIKTWTLNLLKRYEQNARITRDEGFVFSEVGNDPLQYTHIYLPDTLRILAYAGITSTFYNDIDSDAFNATPNHSPIVGWAYDGNPIYGPYGFRNGSAGSVVNMKSSYKLISSRQNGPSESVFPLGFFVEDYFYEDSTSSGAEYLDEHNGRYCKTPEYPEGTYAYFCTVDNSIKKQTSIDAYIPKFPYIIGNTYHSLPIDFNFDLKINQSTIDINKTNWYRNTTPYNFNSKYSYYRFFEQPNKIKEPVSKIKYASYGEIESVDVVIGGEDYKIGDKIIFKNKDVIGQDSTASVSRLKGKPVTNISVVRSSFENVEFEKFNNDQGIIGFVNEPHQYNNGDTISIITPIERISFQNIKITSNNLFLTKELKKYNVGVGIVTTIEVSGDLSYPKIRENDIYRFTDGQNGYEHVKILNIDAQKSTVRIQRIANGNVGLNTVYSGTRFEELTRKFEINLGIQTNYNFKSNYEYHFNSLESIGFGTDNSSLGITSTIYSKYSNSSLVIPQRSIYLPNHGFETNQPLYFTGGLTYNKGGQSLNTQITDQILYAVRINNDLIGLSTTTVGFGSTGSIVGPNNSDPLLYFNKVGGDTENSLKTLKTDVFKAKISQNIVTVSTSSTHGLISGDVVHLDLKPRNQIDIVVEYNDENRVMVLNPKRFLSGDVDISSNTIRVLNHNLLTKDKIIYRSLDENDEVINEIGGLNDNQVYYVVVIDRNTIALCETLYETTLEFPSYVNLSNPEAGKIYKINPQILAIKNQTLNFDLSHPSLSIASGNSVVRTSSFTFDIYEDGNFNYKYFSSSKTKNFDVVKTGTIGVTPNASLKLYLSDESPNNLYYKLSPIQFENNLVSKLGILTDDEQDKNNRITTIDSKYNGSFKIFDILDINPNDPPFTDATFKYQIPVEPESDSYSSEDCSIVYTTNSTSAFGEISKIDLKNRGRYFYSLPQDIKIESKIGTGAIVSAASTNIGEIKTVEIMDIGFNYASDLSVRPIAKLPTIFKVEPLYSIDKIRIDSTGINYLTAPDIVVIDKKTNQKIEDISLRYALGDNFVTIEQNTKNLSSIIPRVIPTNNSNGISLLLNQADIIILDVNNNSVPQEVVNGVDNALLPEDADENDYNFPDSIQYNNLTTIQVFLSAEYSSIKDFPFELGDFVFIEDVVTIAESQGLQSKGFNSSSNDYSFYKVVGRDPNIGGAGASITLDFKGYLDPDIEDPEDSIYYQVDDILSEAARIVPVKYFPKYTVTLKKNNFLLNEQIKGLLRPSSGIVDQWDPVNDYIKIGVVGEFEVGETIIGQSSKTKAILIRKISFDASYNIDSTSIVNKGWTKDTGKLNVDLQRIHDSDYYQYFSYSLKSEVPIDKWEDPVSALNHTAGFKRFSNLEVISTQKDGFSGIRTDQRFGVVTPITDIVSSASVNCVYDFDLVREISFTTGNVLKSNEIVFESRILQDYIESIDNRVLSVDDISKNFNPLPRETAFSIVSRSDSTNIRAKKHFFYIQDRRFSDEKQMLLLTTLHDNTSVYLGQYGRLETSYDMAYFESEIVGDNQNLLFFPARSEVNNFIVDYVSFEISDDPEEELEDLQFGSVARVYNQVGTLSAGSLSGVGVSVVGIASTYRASKILFLVGAASTNYYELNEISVLHDDRGNVRLQEYGELTTGLLDNESLVGIASYSAKMNSSGSELDIVMTPYNDLTDDYNIKTVTISIANTNFTTTDNLGFDTGEVISITKSGIGTTQPSFIEVTNYSTQYKCQYLYLTITGVKTDSILPYNVGLQHHGISDWYAFDDGTVTYSAIYPDTQIIEITPDGLLNPLVSTGSNPQRGTFSITAGNRYYGTKGVHFIDSGEQEKIAPVSYASTTFGHYIIDRAPSGVDPSVGVSSFFIYAIESDATVSIFDNSPDGIAGIASETITVPLGKSGIVTTNTSSNWVFFTSTSPVIITTKYLDGSDGSPILDRGLLSPAISPTGAPTVTKYTNNTGTDRRVTAYNTTVSGIGSIAFFGDSTVIVVETADGSGSDMKQGIPLEYITDTYSFGETLSDYSIVAPYSNTTVNVSYWNGSSWVLGESHVFGISDPQNPLIQSRSGDTGFGVPAQIPFTSSLSGTSADLASGANLWKFESNNPVAIFVNDSADDETELLGFSSSLTERPINKQYEVQELQIINNSRNSYLTEYAKLSISDSPSSGISTSGIGTFTTKLEGSFTRLLFKPSPNTQFEIQGLQINVGRF